MKKRLFSLLVALMLLFAVPGYADVITDVTGPEITNAMCDKQGQTLKTGDTVRFSFKASDPSGLKDGVSVNFYQATSYKAHSFEWTYNKETECFETSYTIPDGVKNGEYYISTIYMYDIYGNQTAEHVHLGFFVDNGIADTTGPEITEAFCDKQGQTLKIGDTVHFSFKASDPSGLREGVSVNFYQATSYKSHSFKWIYNEKTGCYETSYTIPEGVKNGEYYISTIYMYDVYGNQTALHTHLGFFVEGGISDVTGPTITEAKCDRQGQSLKPGDVVHFSFKASDPSGLRDGVSVNFYQATSYKSYPFEWTYNEKTGCFETSYTVPESPKVGEYYISTIYMYDIYGNQTAAHVRLGYFVEPDGHTFSDWKVTKPATSIETGEEERKCTICGHTEKRRIDKLVTPFSDVATDMYYYDPILWAVEKGITNGTVPSKFEPETSCTRGQIVTFLWRAAGQPKPLSSKNPFVDVKSDMYYYDAVLWAVEMGISNGTDATHFGPEEECTRGQVATFLWRSLNKPGPSSSKSPFNDVPKNMYYYTPVLWAVEAGVTNGTDPGKFEPEASCTRGQIVTFLYRALIQ